MVIICLVIPGIMGFSPSFIDDMNIVAIRDMQIKQTNNGHILDTTIVIRNTGTNTVKLSNCELELAVAPEGANPILLGSTRKDEILLDHPSEGAEAYTDTDVQLTIRLGSDIQSLLRALTTNAEIAKLATQPTFALPLNLKGTFDVGVKAEKAWGYQSGIKIDWTITPEIRQEVLATVISAMVSGQIPFADEDLPESMEMTSEPPVTVQEPSCAQSIQGDAGPPPEGTLTINFDIEEYSLSWSAQKQLRGWADQQAERLRQGILCIDGHTDTTGSEEHNQEVSLQRATAVSAYLINTLKITPASIVIKGLGESRPIATGDTPEAHATNRRVEVYVK